MRRRRKRKGRGRKGKEKGEEEGEAEAKEAEEEHPPTSYASVSRSPVPRSIVKEKHAACEIAEKTVGRALRRTVGLTALHPWPVLAFLLEETARKIGY